MIKILTDRQLVKVKFAIGLFLAVASIQMVTIAVADREFFYQGVGYSKT
jgi:hypothetical protein